MKSQMIMRGLGVLAVLWVVVWAGGRFFQDKTATADRVTSLIEEANFSDWSEQSGSGDESASRREQLEDLAEVWNRLDLNERQKLRDENRGMEFFERLDQGEKRFFVELTMVDSMKRMMKSFDQMDGDKRKEFVKRTLKDMESGRDEDELARLQEEDPELLDKMMKEGIRAYYEEASAETKMDLAPLLEGFNHMLQGFSRGGR